MVSPTSKRQWFASGKEIRCQYCGSASQLSINITLSEIASKQYGGGRFNKKHKLVFPIRVYVCAKCKKGVKPSGTTTD